MDHNIDHNIHNKSDKGKSPNLCTHCDKSFLKICNLKRHFMTHTRVKPFKCNLCEKAYYTSSTVV